MTDKELQQKAYEISYLRNQAADIQQQMQASQRAIEELSGTAKALETMKELKQGTLFPLGSGVFTRAKIEDSDTVLIDVGGRLIVERPPLEAKKLIEERKAAIEKNLGELNVAYIGIGHRMEQISAEAEAIASRQRK